MKLLVVGTVASLVGVSITDGIVAARHVMDPSWVHVNAPQDIIPTSLAYGVYMAVSSNIRYLGFHTRNTLLAPTQCSQDCGGTLLVSFHQLQ